MFPCVDKEGSLNEMSSDQMNEKHTHVQSNVQHIFKHIFFKSSDCEIISQNKSIFFSTR